MRNREYRARHFGAKTDAYRNQFAFYRVSVIKKAYRKSNNVPDVWAAPPNGFSVEV